MITWNVINFILILALFGIVIFLLIKRKKESYTPTAQMNENIRNNANVIGTIVNTIDTLIGKKGLVIINKENIAKINKELIKIIGTGGEIAIMKGEIANIGTQLQTGGISLAGTQVEAGTWFIKPNKNTLSFCYEYRDAKFPNPLKVVTVAIMKFIPTQPGSKGTPGEKRVIGQFLNQGAYMPAGGCTDTPCGGGGLGEIICSNPHVPSYTQPFGPPA